jgi:hypothetical protein
VLPPLAVLSAAGLVARVGPWLREWAIAPAEAVAITPAGVVAMFLFGLLYTLRLTYEDPRPSGNEPQDRILFGGRDAVNRLLAEAGRRLTSADCCFGG